MIDLPAAPPRIARLPKERRGYPVPWFLAWFLDGEEVARKAPGATPDFRVICSGAREQAVRQSLCWICGDRMGVHKVYTIGPMCVVNRTTMEPPSHRACAEYAVIACPFLVKPRMKRLPMNEGEGFVVDGYSIERNPGVTCLYEGEGHPFKVKGGGWLIRLDDPARVDWWAEGRQATFDEVTESIAGGLPTLYKLAKAEGQDAIDELDRLGRQLFQYLPAA